MSTSRLKQLICVCIALATAAGCGDNAPPQVGSIAINITDAPTSIAALRVVVTDVDPVIAITLTFNTGTGVWSGTLDNVPIGVHTIKAFGCSTDTDQCDADNNTLIFSGTKEVTVDPGPPATATIVLAPTPGNGMLNTPPLIVSLSHSGTVGVGQTTTLTAIAIDPDVDQTLTYSWDDGLAEGSFDPATDPGVEPGVHSSTEYTAPDVEGTVTITLTVTDTALPDHGETHITIPLVVVPTADVNVNAGFETLPNVTITTIAPRTVLPGEPTTITYTLSSTGADTGAVTASWSVKDSACGEFGTFIDHPTLDVPLTVTFTTPFTGTHDPECDFTLTLTSVASQVEQLTTFVVWEPARIVFVTSTQHNGNFSGSLSDADTFCNDSAAAAGLRGAYKAMLSTEGLGNNAIDHIDNSMYALPDGTPVTSSRSALFALPLTASPQLQHAIDMDEFGHTHTGEGSLTVFTGSNPDGTLAEFDGTPADCDLWDSSNSSDRGAVGSTGSAISPDWIHGAVDLTCDQEASLYCFEAVID